jgi:hypothetical protein
MLCENRLLPVRVLLSECHAVATIMNSMVLNIAIVEAPMRVSRVMQVGLWHKLRVISD